MANKLIILTEDMLNNVMLGLGELQAKFSHAILVDIASQVALAEKDLRAHIELVETHLKPLKDQLTELGDQHAE